MASSQPRVIAAGLVETFGRQTFTYQEARRAGIDIDAGMIRRLHGEGVLEVIGPDGKPRRRHYCSSWGPTVWRVRSGVRV